MNIFTLVSAVLHLGNIEFTATSVKNMDASEIENAGVVRTVAKLLQVDADPLSEGLTNRSTLTRGEMMVTPLSATQARDVRDAFVKGLYGRNFIYIVEKINKAIYKPQAANSKRNSIGVLDIFGFENFAKNRFVVGVPLFTGTVKLRLISYYFSFEQLCINFANENLQQFFVRHIFKLEQHEYDKEAINWTKITFKDNQYTLDMLSEKPLNILALIDEESRFPKGTDESLLAKLHENHGSHTSYVKSKSRMDVTFGIVHFAGTVFYYSPGFLDKNRDTFSADLLNLVGASKNAFIASLCSDLL
jgi:myosin-7